MTCGECGSKRITRKNVKGRYFPYRDYPPVIITVDLELLVCESCQNIITKAGEGILVDEAIKASLKEQGKL